jgi:hypothetical protein
VQNPQAATSSIASESDVVSIAGNSADRRA